MQKWDRLPKTPDSATFTDIRLDPEVVGPQLEALPSADAPSSLPGEVLELRERLVLESLHESTFTVRKDQKDLNETERQAFKSAVEKLVADGIYRSLVLEHADMSHNMHGSMSALGLLRFLPWHRRYLVEFEQALQAADRTLREDVERPISLPYWQWIDDFPEWLDGFLPASHPNTGDPVLPRSKTPPPEKPSATDIDLVRNYFRNQLPVATLPPGAEDYIRFTYALEGWGSRADGSSLPAHNHVHDWTGGIMSNPRLSPTDPIFWLHHAEVDRLWHDWQLEFGDSHPPLTGDNRILDPWTESYDEVRAVEGLRYTYA